MMIFHDKCNAVELLLHEYMQVVSFMLDKRTLNHFYSNHMQTNNFNQFCISMKKHFEESEWHCHNLNKWHFMHIRDIIFANSTLSLSECLQKLCENINNSQQDIDLRNHQSFYLRENLIWAYRDHSTLVVDLRNSSTSSSFFVKSFCISIINWESIDKSEHTYFQQDINGSNHNQCFIDKQYRCKSFNNRDNRSFVFNSRSRNKFTTRVLRKYFVCSKTECWSTNHIEKKRDDSKKRFSDRNSAYKERSKFERRLEQFIVEYENSEKNEFMTQYFEELIIDTDVSFEETLINKFVVELDNETQSFLIFVDSLNDSKTIINIMTNKIFTHKLISKDNNIDFAASKSYVYIAFIAFKYDNREFKDILIDYDATNLLFKNIEQFTILQRIGKIELNKNDVISFRFEIDRILSIDFIQLNTLVDVITFHIVFVNILFLLCLVNMNRLRFYFNNLINMLSEKHLKVLFRRELYLDQSQIRNANNHDSNQIRNFEFKILMNLKSLIQNDNKRSAVIIDFQIDLKLSRIVNNLQISLKMKHHSIIRRYDQVFLLWNIFAHALIVESLNENLCMLTKIELHCFHWRLIISQLKVCKSFSIDQS
jgi:hypothetical protein